MFNVEKDESYSVSSILKKIQEDQSRHTIDIFEYFVCQKDIGSLKEFLNMYSYKNTKTKYFIANILIDNRIFLNDKKNKIRILNMHSKIYYGITRKMIEEYYKNKKISEKTYALFSKARNDLNNFFIQLIIDIEGYEKKFDNLTGLLNRKYFLEESKIHFNRIKHTVVMADIDFFKNVNDKYGHPVGDLVIKKIANIFKDNLRINDLVGRYGGEEFIFILTGHSAETYIVIERLRKIIEDFRLELTEGELVNFTCSFGLVNSETNVSVLNLIKRADKALYLSKEKGRNKVTIHENL